ncbi:MAG: CHAT domain-containing protein [Verrucomicrobiales bacterium]|nr:CHAT domain-containing protein [Verrucomicrobiales bacterium]
MNSPIKLKLAGGESQNRTLPAALAEGLRSAGSGDAFLNSKAIRTKQVFDLSRARRGESTSPVLSDGVSHDDVVVLETETGETLFLNPETLRSAAKKRGVSIEDGLDLDALQPGDEAQRGGLGSIWKKATILGLDADDLIGEARRKAVELATEWLGEKLQDLLLEGPSWIGARAIAWAVESRLLQAPGVYRWIQAAEPRDALARVTADQLAKDADSGPLLLFLHGTGSNTIGSFGDLRSAGRDWDAIQRTYGDRIYALEHRTLSESPVENALMVAQALPPKARLSVVTHSRGGLVGDLLCLGGLADDIIAGWQRRPAPGLKASEIDKVTERERQLLRALRDELASKNFAIDRYVRVACPARGTLLASGNIDVFLSGLLSVIGTVSGLKTSGVYSGVARILMEIVKRRMDPQAIPGIEAMLPDAPLPELLSRASRKSGVRMAVIAGDIEGGSFWQKVGVLFTDWTFFDRLNNDLVVDTDAMYEGLARQGGAHGLFDQGPRVNHFRYFDNPRTRSALSGWLTAAKPDTAAFEPIAARGEFTSEDVATRRSRGAKVEEISGRKPVVVFLPGTMGSHLELKPKGDASIGQGNRIWFDVGSLTVGGFVKLRFPDASGGKEISPESLFEMFYGKLCDHLEATHDVVRFPYDWRKPIEEEADRLAEKVAEILDRLDSVGQQPVRLLAHSMGGLVCRALIARSPEVWKRIVGHPSGRFVMLGTPNNGSHLLVQHFIGKAGTTRTLAKLDLRHDLQQILDVAATMPGALQLLPRPGFVDTASEQAEDYFAEKLWADYRSKCFDRWFGDGVCAQPGGQALTKARGLWSRVLQSNQVPQPADRVHYVFGVDSETPCGIQHYKDPHGRDAIRPLMTGEGDGSVTWKSGQLSGMDDRNLWWIDAGHGDLTRKQEAFAGIVELLEEGRVQGIGAAAGVRPGRPRTRAAGSGRVQPFEAGPPWPPSEEEIAAGLFGSGRPVSVPRRRRLRHLRLSVSAGDLRYAQQPILCGHYLGDPIAGAEAMLDRDVVGGGLRQRERLGFYASEIGTSTVVLLPAEFEAFPERRRGAVVIGLGEYGKLGAPGLMETVRAGVLRFLIAVRERLTGGIVGGDRGLALAPLLVGYNSTTNISIDDSISAIVRGVMAANRHFADAMGDDALQVTRLNFTELYLETAINAVHALCRLPDRLKRELEVEKVSVEIDALLRETSGARRRLLDAGGGAGYWPRLLVTDADQSGIECPPECYEVRRVSPMPLEVLQNLQPKQDCACKKSPEGSGGGPSNSQEAPPLTPPPRIAERLRYLYLTERARAESVVRQRQPQLIEQLIDSTITSAVYDEDLSRMFFQLMVPLDFKEMARHAERMVLVVDAATSAFPWEMLVADDEPMVVKTRMVRQFVTTRFRAHVRGTAEKAALVIGNPSTAGIGRVFAIRDPRSPEGLSPLGGAEEEAEVVRAALVEGGYQVTAKIGQNIDARSVMAAVFRRSYRILHIAAHGLFEVLGRDGLRRSGVVLSDGLVLSAAEIGQMEVVPELVFLNCCHLGRSDGQPKGTNRLAGSIARELIDMGVRCVIAAGWEVDDGAAALFAGTFYQSMLREGEAFGEAVTRARRQVWQDRRTCNTWGAYQAYGDPAFKLSSVAGQESGRSNSLWVSPLEICARIDALTAHVGAGVRGGNRKPSSQDVRGIEANKEMVKQILETAPVHLLAQAEVQAALGRFYGEVREFAKARTAYEAALSAESSRGELSIQVIEQLANLEAKEGERNRDLALVDRALSRLEGLLRIPSTRSWGDDFGPANSERWSIYGSANKRKAWLLVQKKEAERAHEWLQRARNAYAVAEGRLETNTLRSYPAINRVQLDALIGIRPSDTLEKIRIVLAKASELATQAFSVSGDFFDAVMPADAELALALLNRQVSAHTTDLIRAYRTAAAAVPSSERQFNSVVGQLTLLVGFAQAFGLPKADIRGLQEIAAALGAEAPSDGQTPPTQAERATPRRRIAVRTSKSKAPTGRRRNRKSP